MFRKKARLIIIYKFVFNKIIIKKIINYSLHNFISCVLIKDIGRQFEGIVDCIQILDLKKASGPDKISHKMLKIAPENIDD
jgi:hypothetical protein